MAPSTLTYDSLLEVFQVETNQQEQIIELAKKLP